MLLGENRLDALFEYALLDSYVGLGENVVQLLADLQLGANLLLFSEFGS